MTKQELINKYGEAWYEHHKIQMNNYQKKRYVNEPEYRESRNARRREHYQNDSEYRESNKARVKEYRKFKKTYFKERYVEDGRIDLIENYELALADDFKGWDIHHRFELHPDGTVRFTMQSLIKLDLYYNRPSSELIWLSRAEHMRIHSKGRERTQRGNLWI